MRIIPCARRDLLGEGPLWSDREKALYWVDIVGQRVSRLMLDGNRVDSWDIPEMIGWVIERRDAPGFVVGLRSGFAYLSLDPFRIDPIADPQPDLPGNRMNDAKADAAGRLWAGTMPLDGEAPTGGLYRLDPDGRVATMDRGYRIANGPAISPDGRWLIHTDSALRKLYRFALHVDGTLGPREDFLRFRDAWGTPDGMTFDAEGGLWIACWGGSQVARFAPDGVLDRVIRLPASQITSCTFAGEALDRMFVTSAAIGVDEPEGGALFEVDPGCQGLAPMRFAG